MVAGIVAFLGLAARAARLAPQTEPSGAALEPILPILDPLSTGTAPPLVLVGVDHRSAPIELREKVAYPAAEAEALLARLLAAPEIAEAVVLSTCNRTEIYLRPAKGPEAYRTGLRLAFLERAPEIEEEGRFYVKHGITAARHLFEVACGLRSMVLGEPEVLGQVRQAAELGHGAGASGPLLDHLFHAAQLAGRRARGETMIGAGAVSFGYAVVELARRTLGRLEGCSVLLVGAGETAQQVARSLVERGACELWVTNRGPERVEQFLAAFPQARALPFEARREALARVDVAVASTAAEHPVLSVADLHAAQHRPRPLLVVDLGVPRNVEAEAATLEHLQLHDLDSLEVLISHNLRRRREEVPRVEAIVDEEALRFERWLDGRGAEPLIARLQRRAEAIRRRELEGSLDRFPPELRGEVERLTRALVRKLLHHPTERLRTSDDDRGPRLDLVRDLFQLDDES